MTNEEEENLSKQKDINMDTQEKSLRHIRSKEKIRLFIFFNLNHNINMKTQKPYWDWKSTPKIAKAKQKSANQN